MLVGGGFGLLPLLLLLLVMVLVMLLLILLPAGSIALVQQHRRRRLGRAGMSIQQSQSPCSFSSIDTRTIAEHQSA